ncbi:MAG: winged helix-turn-helix domain-containing protein [Firmicutes bacterium]|jgi:DNA-binding response OmpR family regulator|nr:winged helix-turn-helix domain-containing protein [Bacillota bacterium]
MVTVPVNVVRLAPGLRFDLRIHGIWRHQELVPISEVPYRLLDYFCRHPRQLVTMKTLLRVGWNNPPQRTVYDIYRVIHQLRQVLEADSNQPKILISERGLGYVLLIPHQPLRSYS